MAFDGNGTFLRIMNWVQDAAAAIKIKADRHDQQDDDFAAGLTNCLTKDGQTQPTNHIPMNGHKLVNLADPTNDTDAANKKYVDAIKSFSKGLEVSGADDLGRLKFTSSTGANGLAFTGADLSWLARLLDATATPPTKNRLVLNTKPDGTGTDIMIVNDDGTLVAAISLTAPSLIAKALAAGNAQVAFQGSDGTMRGSISTTGDAQGDLIMTVGSKTVVLTKDGEVKATGAVYAGAAALGGDGNIVGSAWSPWGSTNMQAAISARIESRAQAWANDRVANLNYRRVSQGYSGSAASWVTPAGGVVTGYERVPGGNGQVAGLYFMYLQAYDPVRGWYTFGG